MKFKNLKGGKIICTCVDGDIFEDNREIELHGFNYELFEEKQCGGVQEGINGYTYFKHIFELWPGGWVEQLVKMNEEVSERNKFELNKGRNRQYGYF